MAIRNIKAHESLNINRLTAKNTIFLTSLGRENINVINSQCKDYYHWREYMIGGLGVWELLIILVIVIVIFGAKKLPEIGGGIGQAISNFKKASREPEELDLTPKNEEREEDGT
jgi:sec-independent protein translocase protein TatA